MFVDCTLCLTVPCVHNSFKQILIPMRDFSCSQLLPSPLKTAASSCAVQSSGSLLNFRSALRKGLRMDERTRWRCGFHGGGGGLVGICTLHTWIIQGKACSKKCSPNGTCVLRPTEITHVHLCCHYTPLLECSKQMQPAAECRTTGAVRSAEIRWSSQ